MQKQQSLANIAIFCGSSVGAEQIYQETAITLADYFVNNQIQCIYGGANVGLMGIIANRILSQGGKVTGVIPEDLISKEIAHRGLTELIQVSDMHSRKKTIYDLADAFILLPGGFGSVEEFTEITTWTQLGYYQKPLGILNINQFYTGLIGFFQQAVNQRFIHEQHLTMINVHDDPSQLVQLLQQATMNYTAKWL